MSDARNGAVLKLPDDLVTRLAAFERRLRRVETALAALVGLGGILLTYGILLASDRVWDTPAWARLALTAAGGLAFGFCALWWLRHWWWRRRDTRELAKLVQRRFGRLGDRLLGIVELAQTRTVPGHMSEALCRAAMRQVEADASRYDFREAVSSRRAWRWAMGVGAMLLLLAVPVFLAPEAGRNALLRWLRPLSDVERFTFARVDDLPAELVVPRGEPFEIACRLSTGARWRPERAICRIADRPLVEARVTGGVAVFRMPGETEEATLHMKIGDVFKRMLLKPMNRPELVGMAEVVRLPSYLQRPIETNRVEGGTVRAVAGAQLRLVGTVSRPLGSAATEEDKLPVEIAGQRFTTAWFDAGSPSNCVFRWSDRFGLACAKRHPMRVESVPDAAPLVECRDLAPVVAILQDETVRFKTAASDDFGLRNLRIEMTLRTGPRKEAPLPPRLLREGGPAARSLDADVAFSPLVEHIPEDSQVTLRATTEDYLPGRASSLSEPYRILVLSRAQHAKLLAANLDALLGKMDDLARAEEDLLSRTRELLAQPAEALKSDKAGEKIKGNEATERRNSERMEDLMRELKDMIKDALRNKEIPSEMMQQWAEALKQGQSLNAGEWSRAKQALAKAAAQPSERNEKMKAAESEEANVLKALREMINQMNSAVEDIMAASLANRLRQVARTEGETAAAMLATAAETVGLNAEELPPAAKERLGHLAGRHAGACEAAGTIREDLGGFFRRTLKEAYGEVFDAMTEARTSERMAEVGSVLRANRHQAAAEGLNAWKTQFEAWAAKLEDKGGAGGEGGGEGGSGEQMDMATFLELARLRRREEAVREQTRTLDRGRNENASYRDDTGRLAGKQEELAGDTRQLGERVKAAKMKPFIEAVGALMEEATGELRKPQTGSDTIAIQTQIIEALAGLMSQGASQSGSMAAMGQMLGMGMSAGPSGGGSMAGGEANGANTPINGAAAGSASDPRGVSKSTSADSGRWPEEYRGALQTYFKGLEEDK